MNINIEDPDELKAYLVARGVLGQGDTIDVRTLAGGVSNRTVLFRLSEGRAWVIKQALEKLRVQVDWFSSPKRVINEGNGLIWLNRLAAPGAVPAFVFLDPEACVLAMEAVPDPHANLKELLMTDAGGWKAVSQAAWLLATIHRESSSQRERVQPVFQDTTFFESLRLEPYYAYAAGCVPEAAEFLTALIASTREESHRHCLVHGDYSPKNMLVHGGKVILLDHEVIHWGDPAFDVGFFLTHLLSKARHFPERLEAFFEAALHWWRIYSDALGSGPWSGDMEVRCAQHLLACLLARVAGRSPLEYLSVTERSAQRAAVVATIRRLRESATVNETIHTLRQCLS